MPDTKITQLATLTSLSDDDLFPIADNVATTPVNKSVRFDALKLYTSDLFAVTGTVGNGSTDDQAAIQAAFNAASRTKVIFPSRATFAIASPITIPADLDVDFNGSTIRRTTSDTSSAAQIVASAGATIRNLVFEVPTGITINRGVAILDGGRAHNIKLTSTDQQANSANNNHYGFKVEGDDTRVYGLVVENFDYAVLFRNSDDGEWNDIRVKSYVRGVKIDTCNRFQFTNYLCHTKSANGTTDPGHNGLLMGDNTHGKLSNIDVKDSGEHGIYVSASTVANKNLGFSNIHTTRTGQSGFKLLGTLRNQDISINGLTVRDCHWNNAAGTNEDGLRIELCDRITVTGFSVNSQSSSDGSCYRGIFISDSSDVMIVSPLIVDTVDDAIHITDDGLVGNVNRIYITSPVMQTIGGNGVTIDVEEVGSTLRNVEVINCYMTGVTGYAVEIESLDDNLLQPVIVTGKVNDAAAGMFNNVNGVTVADLNIDIVQANRYENATGTFTASVYLEETRIDSAAGAVAVTIPNATIAGVRRKVIRMIDSSNASTVTVTTHETSSPEVFTFDSTVDVLILEWTGGRWYTLKNTGVTT